MNEVFNRDGVALFVTDGDYGREGHLDVLHTADQADIAEAEAFANAIGLEVMPEFEARPLEIQGGLRHPVCEADPQ